MLTGLRHQMGQKTPDSIHTPRLNSMAGKGLKLERGPDPRSFDSSKAGVHASMRDVLGMSM